MNLFEHSKQQTNKTKDMSTQIGNSIMLYEKHEAPETPKRFRGMWKPRTPLGMAMAIMKPGQVLVIDAKSLGLKTPSTAASQMAARLKHKVITRRMGDGRWYVKRMR